MLKLDCPTLGGDYSPLDGEVALFITIIMISVVSSRVSLYPLELRFNRASLPMVALSGTTLRILAVGSPSDLCRSNSVSAT